MMILRTLSIAVLGILIVIAGCSSASNSTITPTASAIPAAKATTVPTSTSASTPASTPTTVPAPSRTASDLLPVTNVVDGDTIDVQLQDRTERIRIIGIDTPEVVDPREPVQCFGREASAKAKELLSGQQVNLIADPTQDNRDRYNRLLRYVEKSDGTDFGLWMISNGYANEYTYQIPYQRQTSYKAAQAKARENSLGLWSPTICNGDTKQAADRVATPTIQAPAVQATATSTRPVPPTPSPTVRPPLAPTPTTPPSTGFNPNNYIGQGDRYNCADFKSQAEAQQVLRADNSDPNRLDTDKDGIACESNKAPYDRIPVPR